MKQEKPIFKDLFTKLQKVFTKDAYIIDHQIVTAGDLSSEECNGFFLCELNERYRDEFTVCYPNKNLLYIDDLRSAKDEPDNHIKEVTNILEIDKINHRFEKLANTDFDKSLKWGSFSDFKDQFDDLFNNKKVVLLKPVNHPYLIISSSLLPLVGEKNAEDVEYVFQELEDGVCKVIFKFDFGIFQVWYNYYYLNIDD